MATYRIQRGINLTNKFFIYVKPKGWFKLWSMLPNSGSYETIEQARAAILEIERAGIEEDKVYFYTDGKGNEDISR